MANSNRCKFILPDSPEQDFLLAGIGVEAPRTALLNQGNWERPVFSADVQRHRSVSLTPQAVHLLILLDEQFALSLILSFVSRRGEICRSTQDVCNALYIVLHSLEKGLTCLGGRRERLLSGLLSQTRVGASYCPYRGNREHTHCGAAGTC